QTDGEGRYRLEGIPPGRYFIAAGSLTYPSYYPGVANRNQGRIVTVVAGQVISGLDFKIERRGGPLELWGRVGFDDGSPLPSAMLQRIVPILSSASAHRTTTPFTLTQGNFMFPSVEPGEYSVTLAPLPLGYYVKSMAFGNIDLTKRTLTQTESSSNTPIRVVLTKMRPADTPSGVNVSGRAPNQNTLMLKSVTPVLDQVHPENVFNIVATVVPMPDGSFRIEGVLPGTYTLGTGTSNRSLAFVVTGNDVTNLDLGDVYLLPIALSSSSIQSISGTVEVGDGKLPAFEIRFATIRSIPAATYTAMIAGKEFSIALPEGEYRVSVSGLPQGYTLESVNAGPLDLSEPFLVARKGVADRFTGVVVSSTITVRLKAPQAK
ncbi:MAG TPA: hypothetical protein VK210_17935, partial [Terriglobia bacterium]|nr:hypothetical protein [Terriglobia bacterium]